MKNFWNTYKYMLVASLGLGFIIGEVSRRTGLGELARFGLILVAGLALSTVNALLLNRNQK